MASFLFLLLALPAGGQTAPEPAALYVSPSGRDTWSGRFPIPQLPPPPAVKPGEPAPPPEPVDGPFRTLERAREEARRLKAHGPVTVWIRAGTYSLPNGFTLGAADSGTEAAPAVYRAFPNEEVRLLGGREIPAEAFRPVTDPSVLERMDRTARGKVWQADLRALGISDFGELRPRGFGRPDHPAALELFFQDRPMPPASWPNDGWARIAKNPAPGPDRFTMEGDRARRWAGVEGAWLHGYWTWDWADSTVELQSIDPERGLIVTKAPHGVYGYTGGKRFRIFNLLEELDAPGEWHLDRRTGILYFWPPRPLREGRVFVSTSAQPIVSIQGASHLVLRGLILEAARGDGLAITEGTNILVAGCTIRNVGRCGVVIRGGSRNGVQGSEICGTGETGVVLEGGDRKTLTPAGHFAVNNHIHDYARWCRTYRPGVLVSGVGQRVAHNRIHDAPHNAILLGGNEHLIEYNEIYRVCRETGDAGAFYMGRDWTMRGNIVRYNLFHHLEGVQGQEGFTDVMGVYLDDAASGATVFGNVFYRVRRAVMVGGGRDNVVENNLFVECPIGVHVDARGIGWARNHIRLEGGDWGMKGKLEAVRWKEPPYSVKYPRLATILEEEPYFPKGTVVARNVAFQCKEPLHLQDGLTDKTIAVKDNFFSGNPGLADPARMDFRLSPASPAFRTGFQKIPLEKIGLQKDEYRVSLPAPFRP